MGLQEMPDQVEHWDRAASWAQEVERKVSGIYRRCKGAAGVAEGGIRFGEWIWRIGGSCESLRYNYFPGNFNSIAVFLYGIGYYSKVSIKRIPLLWRSERKEILEYRDYKSSRGRIVQ